MCKLPTYISNTYTLFLSMARQLDMSIINAYCTAYLARRSTPSHISPSKMLWMAIPARSWDVLDCSCVTDSLFSSSSSSSYSYCCWTSTTMTSLLSRYSDYYLGGSVCISSLSSLLLELLVFSEITQSYKLHTSSNAQTSSAALIWSALSVALC